MSRVAILLGVLALTSVGCGDDDSTQAVTIDFQAKVGDQVFVCGKTYDNLGANDTSLQINDFRFYVQDVELKNANGDYVALELDTSNWQTENVALLDFEDDCSDFGDDAMNSVVTGTVPKGTYDGLRFVMGVPFALNHNNPATAMPPLNLTTMQWNWQGGYKFLRIDSTSSGAVATEWHMHLGSTGCDGDPFDGGISACRSPNRVDVDFSSFDAESNTVVADFAALVSSAALDVNQPGTALGCQSDATDSDCGPIFENLGLAFGTAPAGTQQFFSVE